MSDSSPQSTSPSEPADLARQQLEEALSFLSHDAREGHASTLALLELQRLRVDPMTMGELVERIERNSRRSLALIDDFMDIARARSRPMRPAEVDLVDELVDVVAEAWLAANAKGVRVRVAPGPEAAPCVVDRELFHASLTKLVRDAAVKAPRGGEVVCALVERDAQWVVELHEAELAPPSGAAAVPASSPGASVIRRPERVRRSAVHADPGLDLARILVERFSGSVEVDQPADRPRLVRLSLPR